TLFEQRLQFDFRDDTRRPTLGLLVGLDAQQAAFLDWDFVRLVPEVRGYVPLGPLVLAARFRLGYLKIFSASSELDAVSSRLGPQRYRLRLGGANSHRGYVAGFLGDDATFLRTVSPELEVPQNSGGLRRWEGSLELRAPISEDLGVVFFADVGDVNRGASFRFDQLNLALGFGLRYQTLIGPVRFDFGALVPGAQTTRGCQEVRGNVRLGAEGGNSCEDYGLRGAFHLTIGEAF
ncbi:MAG: BamA/TamA family outer membrane protein, partial [Myxococcota bacterium]